MARGSYERGSALVEYLLVAMGLIVVWGTASLVVNLLHEHETEYNWALSLPL